MTELRIARFVDKRACRSIFSDYPTFVLRSPLHYRKMEREAERGDDAEFEVCLSDGGSASTTSSCFLISCWTVLDDSEPTQEEWGIFKDSVLAILSTPARVCSFLEDAFGIERGKTRENRDRKFPFICVIHRQVMYADEVSDEITPENIMDITVFTKRLKFAKQK